MQPEFVDRYSRGSSWVHRLDARWKLIAAISFVIAVVATPREWWPFYVVAAVIVLGVYALARLPAKYLAMRLAAFLPFLALLAVAVPLSRGFVGGWDVAGQLLARSLVSLAAMVTLVATTPFAALLTALAQLRVPQVLISILAFMYRYLFVLFDEFEKMRRARLARSFYPTLWGDLRMSANFIGILFVRAFERAERVYAAMCARGWTGQMPTEDEPR